MGSDKARQPRTTSKHELQITAAVGNILMFWKKWWNRTNSVAIGRFLEPMPDRVDSPTCPHYRQPAPLLAPKTCSSYRSQTQGMRLFSPSPAKQCWHSKFHKRKAWLDLQRSLWTLSTILLHNREKRNYRSSEAGSCNKVLLEWSTRQAAARTEVYERFL